MAVRRSTVVLYDPATGDIVHGHTCEFDDSEVTPAADELEKEAREHADRHVKDKVKLKNAALLHAGESEIHSNRRHRVDVKLKKLVSE